MLTEVILGKETGDKALAVALDYVAAIKKTPIVVNDTRGFSSTAASSATSTKAYDMLIEACRPAMIENAAKMAGMPVGPLSLNDEVAIDLSQKILKATVADLGEAASTGRHMALINKMVDELDRRGRKNEGLLRLPGETGQEVASGRASRPSIRRSTPTRSTSTSSSSASSSPSRWKPPAPSRKASSPIPARPTSAPSSASVSRPIPAGR